MTPLACGSDALRLAAAPDQPGGRDDKPARPGAFVASHANNRDKDGRDPGQDSGQGITLGTAMTISGAAASPNMGYYTSSATAVLLTLFNLRLGAWLPNPAKGIENCNRSGPKFAIQPYLREMVGLVGADGSDLYISDGGHFENLGLYEMIRRRCRFIIVVDAGQDPAFSYNDLANAIRKVWIDFQVEVRLPVEQIRPSAETGRVDASWIVGEIAYPQGRASAAAKAGNKGQILYIKASLPGDLPADLVGYAALNKRFPNDSTTDQWFDEAQFESYRHLGSHIVDSIGRKGATFDGIQAFFAAASAEAAARTRPSRKADRPAGPLRRRRRPSP